MPTNRMRPWRWLASRRAARRRGSEVVPPEIVDLRREPLPPLVSPDDDREFLESRRAATLEAKTAC